MANNDLVGSVVRAMDILRLAGGERDGVRLKEICRALNLKPPTAYNLARTLAAGGFLEKRGNVFRLGRELFRIAGTQQLSPLSAAADSELLALSQRVPRGAVIFGLAAPAGIEQTHRISFERPGVIQRLPREIMHPYATASGLIGLAFADQESFLIQGERWPFAEFGAHLWKERAALDRFLEEVRKRRLCISPFDRDTFLRVSGAVCDSSGRLVAVIGASIPASRLDGDSIRAIEAEVLRAGRRLEEFV